MVRFIMNFSHTKIHNHATGDKELIDSIKKIIKLLHDENQDKNRVESVFICNDWGSNATTGTIPTEIANSLKIIYERHLELKKESFQKGKEEGKNLLMMLNNGEITTDGFLSR